jgi:hypothetical protein
VPDEIQALARREELERDREALDDLVEVAWSRRPQEGFQLRKRQFDRIEVRTVGRQKAQPRPCGFDRGLDLRLLVHREVIEDDNVARPERRHQDLLDVREKRGIVDRAVEDRRCVETVDPQGRDHGVGPPVTIWRVVAQPDPARTAPVPTDQIGRDARLIDEDVIARVVQAEGVLPAAPRRGDINAPLFVGEYRFF